MPDNSGKRPVRASEASILRLRFSGPVRATRRGQTDRQQPVFANVYFLDRPTKLFFMFVHQAKPNDERPNIIFIITDQQRYDTIAGLGYDYMDTPNLDRLVREGVSFDQCHVTAASCAAARASLFKG